MNLNFSDEQNLLRDSVSRFCTSDYDFETRMKSVNSDSGFSKEHWKLFADLGWLAVPFDEELGGLGGDVLDLSILFEEFGKSIVVEPCLANVVLADGVLKRSGFDKKDEYLSSIISGEKRFCLANYERAKGYNLENIETVLDDKSLLNGSKSTVLNAPNADYFIVFSKKGGDFCFSLVSKDAEGLNLKSYKTYDGFVLFLGSKNVSCVLFWRVLRLAFRVVSHVSCVLCRSPSGLRWEVDSVCCVGGEYCIVSYVVWVVFGEIVAVCLFRTVYCVWFLV